jgi:hypothetical protein
LEQEFPAILWILKMSYIATLKRTTPRLNTCRLLFKTRPAASRKHTISKIFFEFRPVALPFKVEHYFAWEIVLVNDSDTRIVTSYQDQYHLKLIAYIIGADEPRDLVCHGSMWLTAAYATTPCPTDNAALQAYIAQQ